MLNKKNFFFPKKIYFYFDPKSRIIINCYSTIEFLLMLFERKNE